MSEILFYSKTKLLNVIFDSLYTKYTSEDENFEYVYPDSNVLFKFYTSKTQYFAPNVSVVTDKNHYYDQSQVMLFMMLGFRWYIAEYSDAIF